MGDKEEHGRSDKHPRTRNTTSAASFCKQSQRVAEANDFSAQISPSGATLVVNSIHFLGLGT